MAATQKRQLMRPPGGSLVRLDGVEARAIGDVVYQDLPRNQRERAHSIPGVQSYGYDGGSASAGYSGSSGTIEHRSYVPDGGASTGTSPVRLRGLVLVTPDHLNGVTVVTDYDNRPAGAEQPYLEVLDSRERPHRGLLLWRLERFEDPVRWLPHRGTPPAQQFLVLDETTQGAMEPLLVHHVWMGLQKAAEAVRMARYREFVLAELATVNNTIAEFEHQGQLIAQGKRIGEEQKKAFYAIRFSGNIGALRKHEQELLRWLQENPEDDD